MLFLMKKFSLLILVICLFSGLIGCSGSAKTQNDAKSIYEKISQQDKAFRTLVTGFLVEMEKSVKSGSSSVKLLQEKLKVIEEFVEASKKETAALSVPDCDLSKDVIKKNNELLSVAENVVLKMFAEIIKIVNNPTSPANSKMREIDLAMKKGMSEEFKGTGGMLKKSLEALHNKYYQGK